MKLLLICLVLSRKGSNDGMLFELDLSPDVFAISKIIPALFFCNDGIFPLWVRC